MYQYTVLQTQWLILGFIGGLAVVVAWIMCPLALWGARKRREAEPEGTRFTLYESLRVFPWILTLSILGILIYSLAHAVYYFYHPANI